MKQGVALAQQKEGREKTIAVNLATMLAELERSKKVIVADADPLTHTSRRLGYGQCPGGAGRTGEFEKSRA